MIIQGDCIEEMKKLKENSVDAIVTDPPYELATDLKLNSNNKWLELIGLSKK